MSLLDRLSFNQITADPWSLEQVVRNCVENNVPYIAAWRHKLDGDAVTPSGNPVTAPITDPVNPFSAVAVTVVPEGAAMSRP